MAHDQTSFKAAPKVTVTYKAQLLELVAQQPRALGLAYSNWTTANLAEHLAEFTGIELSARQVENILKANDRHLGRPVRLAKHKQGPELVQEKRRESAVEVGS